MKYQEFIIDNTRTAMNEAFRSAKAVPADKLEWSPLDQGRSVLDLCRELARCGEWTHDLVSGKEMPGWDEETMAKEKAITDQWKTVEECEAAANAVLERLYELYRTVPDARLEETRWLPFDGGRDFKIREIMDYPRWNATYHLGQIAYIQILYGDKEMH